MRLAFAILIALFLAIPAAAADTPNKCDSLRVNTLNMTEEEIAQICGIDSTKLAEGPTLQELNEENPTYVKREYTTASKSLSGASLCSALLLPWCL